MYIRTEQLHLACSYIADYYSRMFSDTHFHLKYMAERGIDCSSLLAALAERDTFFALDIGTYCDDLISRMRIAETGCSAIDNLTAAQKARRMLYFAAGIWPAPEAISARVEQVDTLRAIIYDAQKAGTRLVALGECGMDHHWNIENAEGGKVLLDGEEELFSLQLELARDCSLPVIVHSREAFDSTISCIRNIGYDRGIIHCYSYGVDEARAFLDRGWYISFSGSVTYTKKSCLDEIQALLQYVPRDRLLIETDAPYLTPVPYRGKTNTPVFICHTYEYVANCIGITSTELSVVVDENIKQLFNLGENVSRETTPVPIQR